MKLFGMTNFKSFSTTSLESMRFPNVKPNPRFRIMATNRLEWVSFEFEQF